MGAQELEQAAEHDAKRLRWDGDDGVDDEEDDTSEELDTGGQPLVVIHTSFVDVSAADGAPVICRRCICCKVSMGTHTWQPSLRTPSLKLRPSCGNTPQLY